MYILILLKWWITNLNLWFLKCNNFACHIRSRLITYYTTYYQTSLNLLFIKKFQYVLLKILMIIMEVILWHVKNSFTFYTSIIHIWCYLKEKLKLLLNLQLKTSKVINLTQLKYRLLVSGFVIKLKKCL